MKQRFVIKLVKQATMKTEVRLDADSYEEAEQDALRRAYDHCLNWSVTENERDATVIEARDLGDKHYEPTGKKAYCIATECSEHEGAKRE